jgi:1-deoxy-D-xylulose-5-phosphate reductoisomerase
MKRLSILGSTGSIGRSALNLVDLYPDRLRVVALAARRSSQLLREQCLRYRPGLVALVEPEAARWLSRELSGVRVVPGIQGLTEVACHPEADLVVSAITGSAGLVPTYHAIQAGQPIALANKETLVMAGELLMPLARRTGAAIIPVDSEHSALHQCLRGASGREIQRLILTASGGPFLRYSREEMNGVRVSDALDHPTWDMGPKVTVDSATLMNKGLEVIEAHHFFGARPDQISVAVHPQSVVHSVVEFRDGTMLAQLSITDMRSSLLYALAYPDRWETRLPRLDLFSLPHLAFVPPDLDRFPCLRLAYQALRAGDTFPTALNAANEVAVDLFLRGLLPFVGIPELIERILSGHRPHPVTDLDCVLKAHREAREAAVRLAERAEAR